MFANSYIKLDSEARGFGAIELLVVLGMVGIFMMMAVSNLHELDDPLLNSSAQLVGYLKQVRAKAFASTSAYTISPSSATQIQAEFSNKCSDAVKTADPKLTIDLPSGAFLSDTGWELCINSRGLPDQNLVMDLENYQSQTRQVEIMLGGAVRVIE